MIRTLPLLSRLFVITMAVAALLTANVFAQKVTVEADPAVDFHKYKTFAIREGVVRSPSPVLNNELTKKRIETAIEQALSSKGLTKAPGRADLNVSFIFGSMRYTDTETNPAGARGRRTRVSKISELEGNLIVDMRDPATKSLVWHVVATESESDADKLAKKIDNMVRKAIAKYPPKK